MNESNMSDNRFYRHPFCHISNKALPLHKSIALIVSFILFCTCICSAGAEDEYYNTATLPTASFTVPDAYRDFLFNDGYKYVGQQFYNDDEIIITMWDLNNNGSAELLMSSGSEQENTQMIYVYTADYGYVQYAGEVHCLYPDQGIYAHTDIRGLILYDYDYEKEQEITQKLTLENSTLKTTDLSVDYVLYGTYLHWYKIKSLPALGWEAFRSAPFVLDVLHVDVYFMPKNYIANVPLVASLVIKDGTPPYHINYWYEAINDEEEYSTIVAEGEFQTTDKRMQFSFIPESNKDLWFNLYITDSYGTNTGTQDPFALQLAEGWNQARLFTLMAEIFDSVKDPSQTEGVSYYESLPDNGGWYARFLEVFTDIADPAKALKKAVDTATGDDLNRYLLKNAIVIAASEDTFKLPALEDLPSQFSDINHIRKLTESGFLDECAIYLADNPKFIFPAENYDKVVKYTRDELAQIFKSTQTKGMDVLKSKLSKAGFSGSELTSTARSMKSLQVLGTIFKIISTGIKNYKELTKIYNLMAMTTTLDSKQFETIAEIYTNQGYSIGKELKQFAAASEEERVKLVWLDGYKYLRNELFADIFDHELQLADASLFAALEGTTWVIDRMFGSNSVSGKIYELGQASEMTQVFWRDFYVKRASFLSNPNQANYESACYALINYYKAAAIAEKAFVKTVEEGQKSIFSSLAGFGSPMTVAAERAGKNAETLNNTADNLRRILYLWQKATDSSYYESIGTIISHLDSPDPYANENSDYNTNGIEYAGYSIESIIRGASSTILPDLGYNKSSEETNPETDEPYTESIPEEGIPTEEPVDIRGEESGQPYESVIEAYSGLCHTNKARVNIRSGPDQSSEKVTVWEDMTQSLTITGYAVDVNGTGWYRIVLPDQRTGFIRWDLVNMLQNDAEIQSTEKSNNPGSWQMNGIGFTNKPRVNIRSGPDQESQIVTQWTQTWSPITIIGYTMNQNGTGWYHIMLPNKKIGYIREDLLDVFSIDYSTWICENCGQTGNTGAFCSLCGTSAPFKK